MKHRIKLLLLGAAAALAFQLPVAAHAEQSGTIVLAQSNDAAASWGAATQSYGMGDLGTPGLEAACP